MARLSIPAGADPADSPTTTRTPFSEQLVKSPVSDSFRKPKRNRAKLVRLKMKQEFNQRRSCELD